MAIVFFTLSVFAYLVTSTTAQPPDLELKVDEVDVGGIDLEVPSSGSRDIPLPANGVFEFTCKRSSAIDSNPWYFINSSDIRDPVEVILNTELGSTTNGSVVQYRGSSETTGWILRLTNAPDMYGTYECIADTEMISINIIESNPAVLMSKHEYIANDGENGLFMHIFIAGNPRPNYITDIDFYFEDQKLSLQDINDLGLLITPPVISASPVATKLGGRYTVVVSNEEGSANTSFLVTIQTVTKIELNVSRDIVYAGEPFYFTCFVISGFPLPEFTWSFNDTGITSGVNGYMIEDFMDRSILTVTSANISHVEKYECKADNGLGIVSKSFNLDQIYLPPPIQPVITLASNYPLYTGVNTTLNCSTLLMSPIHDLKKIRVTWSKYGEVIYIDDVLLGEDTADPHVSLYTVPYLSSADAGVYNCSVIVHDDVVSSISITSDQFTLETENPPINITLTPRATQVIATSPYNAITLVCTASVPAIESKITNYNWYLNGNRLSNSTKITITNTGGSSILTDYPSTHGALSYTCEFVVTLSNADPPLKKSTTAIVKVQAPVAPNVPVSSLPKTLSYNTISIKFTIPSIAYDPEQYYIQYGTSSDNLNKMSTVITGNTDLDTKNEEFEIVLSYLDDNTVYYYRIVANNSQGMIKTSVKTFQTPKIQLVQVKAGPFVGCDNGRVQHSTEVKTFLNEKLSERISEACDCSFPQANLVNGSLYCSSEATSTLIYRVTVLPTTDIAAADVVNHLERSLKTDQQFVSGVARISVDLLCNVSLTSLADPLCVSPTLQTVAEPCTTSEGIKSNIVILASVIGGCLLLLFLLTIFFMTGIMCYQHKRLKRIGIKRTSNQYSVVNCRRETSFMDHKPSPPAIAAPAVPPAPKWEGDVSISDCPAYLYSVKPLDNEPPQTIVERQPTPGIYDSIDGLNVTRHLPSNRHPSKMNNEVETDIQDYTGSNDDVS